MVTSSLVTLLLATINPLGALIAVAVGLVVGTLLGLLAGSLRGWVD